MVLAGVQMSWAPFLFQVLPAGVLVIYAGMYYYGVEHNTMFWAFIFLMVCFTSQLIFFLGHLMAGPDCWTDLLKKRKKNTGDQSQRI